MGTSTFCQDAPERDAAGSVAAAVLLEMVSRSPGVFVRAQDLVRFSAMEIGGADEVDVNRGFNTSILFLVQRQIRIRPQNPCQRLRTGECRNCREN
jgi:hypothetical protein